jgi:hypothetical protein
MKKVINLTRFFAASFLLTILFSACLKDDYNNNNSGRGDNQQQGQQNTTSYFGNNSDTAFNKILIDIDSVEVLVDTCNHDSCQVWESLHSTPGMYNLLSLGANIDTLLVHANIPAAEISSIRLSLGPNDSLIRDSVHYPLQLRDSSSILIPVSSINQNNINKNIQLSTPVNFNVTGSTVQLYNNEFILYPYITAVTVNTTASISGTINPLNAYPVITVFNSTDTAYAEPDRYGNFTVNNLTPGTYSVLINVTNGYVDSTISGINLTASERDWLGNINLHK